MEVKRSVRLLQTSRHRSWWLGPGKWSGSGGGLGMLVEQRYTLQVQSTQTDDTMNIEGCVKHGSQGSKKIKAFIYT